MFGVVVFLLVLFSLLFDKLVVVFEWIVLI